MSPGAVAGSPGGRWIAPVRPGDVLAARAIVEERGPSGRTSTRRAPTVRGELVNRDGVPVLRILVRGLFATAADCTVDRPASPLQAPLERCGRGGCRAAGPNRRPSSSVPARDAIGMDRAYAAAVLARLHQAQNVMYAGGSLEPLRAVLCEDVVWTIPGNNAIAGRYAGIDAVFNYFRRRRDQATGTLRLHPQELLVGDGDHVAALTDGTAVRDGVEHRWSTLGLYRLSGDRIAECRLLAFDQAAFDAVWR
jgi:ketosteroid isomerase-like protein